MKQDLTEIAVIVDRSGSMTSIKDDAEGGINQFIGDQKEAEGTARFTLCQFDTNYEIVHDGVDIKDVPHYRLVPGGMTALYDAVGRTIDSIGKRLAALSEEERPSLVTVMIVTDGHENSSREYTGHRIAEMIKHQKDVYNWEFVFLGAEEDLVAAAKVLNVPVNNAVKFGKGKLGAGYAMTSDKLKALRTSRSRGIMTGDMSYTQEEACSLAEDE